MKKRIYLLIPIAILLTGCDLSIAGNDESSSDSGSSSPAVINKYFLPSQIDDTNSSHEDESKTTYEYDDDFLGYTKTRVVEVEQPFKDVEIYRFSDDFSKFTYIDETYDFIDDTYVLDYGEKYEYELYENGSYKYAEYDFNEEIDDYEFYKEVSVTYNENNQIIARSDRRMNDEIEGAYYYYSYETYEYNEEGYITLSSYYDYDNTIEKEKYLMSYETSEYNEDYSHCTRKSYYYYDDEFQYDGYTDVSIVNENGIRKFDEQYYYPDGSEGNHNILHYNENNVLVYSYYGGMNEENGITLNAYNQIENYFFKASYSNIDMDVTYAVNGGSITGSRFVCDYNSGTYTSITKYNYNELGQMSSATKNTVYNEDGVSGEVNYELNVIYSELQNDELLSHMNYLDDIVGSYSYFVLRSDETIY